MDFAFERARHDRAAHLRKDEAWREVAGPDVRVLVVGGEHVATTERTALRWTTLDDAPAGEWLYLGTLGDRHHAAVMVDRLPDDLEPANLRELGPLLDADEASLAVHAVGIARWHQSHRFCARCGQPSAPGEAGHVRICPACGTHHFPRTDPAVIMLITDDDDRALLGRQAAWPQGWFSTLAGFVEPGETLGDAVRREVAEEVGVQVGDVTYAKSQPWPFPSSLMLGFFGQALTTDITVDALEIEEARWFTRQDIRDLSGSARLLDPRRVSISQWLLQHWYHQER